MAKGVKTGGGSRKGIPNKATTEARAVIGLFIESNLDRLQDWLDRVAETDPEKAFQLLNSVIEYHLPKRARTENVITGADGGPVNLSLQVRFGK